MVEHQRQSDNTRSSVNAASILEEESKERTDIQTHPRRTRSSSLVFVKPRGCSEGGPKKSLPGSINIKTFNIMIEGIARGKVLARAARRLAAACDSVVVRRGRAACSQFSDSVLQSLISTRTENIT
jgi:hypothetical protein